MVGGRGELGARIECRGVYLTVGTVLGQPEREG